MSAEILLTLGILLLSVLLLVWEKLRVDLVALLVLVALALTGLISPEEALSGFSNPAVVTVWAVFILSAGLARTGVANRVGRGILRVTKDRPRRMMVIIMLVAGTLSAFMNNVGVAVMLLPVVNHLARRTGQSVSKLLMPLAFGTLTGGMTTLIGTPTNILVSGIAQDFGLPAFNLFDFARLGVPVMGAGILYMLLLGQRLLPERTNSKEFSMFGASKANEVFGLEDRFFKLQLSANSNLAGKTLAESHLGSALKLNVIAIIRGRDTLLAPEASTQLRAGDELLVVGRSDWLDELARGQQIELETGQDEEDSGDRLDVRDLVSSRVDVLEAGIPDGSPLVGQTLAQSQFRERYRANVLGIWQGEKAVRTHLQDIPLKAGDTLLLQASRPRLNKIRASDEFMVSGYDAVDIYELQDRLLLMSVPTTSHLVGSSLASSHLADAFGLFVLGIIRGGKTNLMPTATEKLQAGDKLLVQAREDDVEVLRALQDLKLTDSEMPKMSELESDEVGLVEVILSPHSGLDGKTLREMNFREKFGLTVLAIWRGGRAHRSNLREFPLRYGDSLLVYGHRNRIKVLADEPEFLVLSPEIAEAPKREKAGLSVAIMAAVVLSVAFGWLPIEIAAVTGAAVMVLTECLNMDEAYHSIQWEAIFLIAGMLPLAIAMQSSGAARFLADQVIVLAGPYGPLALMGGLFLLTMLASQVMPNPVVAVLMAPIAISSAADLGFSPQALLMLVAFGASTTFLMPVGHPANVLMMGPGGYRLGDFIKVGLPLTVIVMATVLFLLPVFWPL